jgi:sterol 3beta-glucosyltransferase
MLTHLRISWFLDNPELGWTPPQTLIDWMAKARADKKAIVYIGFGSITVPDPKLVTERIIRSVLKSEYWPLLMACPASDRALLRSGGVRAIVSRGWSARMSKGKDQDTGTIAFPEECYSVGLTTSTISSQLLTVIPSWTKYRMSRL